jgi:type III pantothenate kinase
VNLTVDIGNTSAKAALVESAGGQWRIERVAVEELLADFPEGIDKAIMVSTSGAAPELENAIRARVERFIKFDHTTPLPIENLYSTPATLGADRLAAAVGAHTLFPDRTMLVVDFGTAITYDIVTASGQYLGGNISPGAATRFRSLHDYTEALPLGKLPEGGETTPSAFGCHPSTGGEPPLQKGTVFPARDTLSAIESGVVRGIVAETEHYIAASQEKFGVSGVIFTGGDADYFAGQVNFPIFAVSELVFQGLNAILEHNANL